MQVIVTWEKNYWGGVLVSAEEKIIGNQIQQSDTSIRCIVEAVQSFHKGLMHIYVCYLL